MRRVLLLCFFCGLGALAGACSKSGSSTPGTNQASEIKKKSIHEIYTTSEAPGSSVITALKKKSLADYPRKTVGEAFDGYRFLNDKTWVLTYGGNGKMYVDYTGWSDPQKLDKVALGNGVLKRGLEVKFIITDRGQFYVAMISTVDAATDGRVSRVPMPDIQVVLDSIYANKGMDF